MVRASVTTLVFVVFTLYSLTVVEQQGFLSALDVATQGGWSSQVFIDLCIAMFVSATWMRGDARKKQLTWWPFAVACVPLGSVSILAYASLSAWVTVRREETSAVLASSRSTPT